MEDDEGVPTLWTGIVESLYFILFFYLKARICCQ